jgi:hypothetical protein
MMPQTTPIAPFSQSCISCEHFDRSRNVCTRKNHYEFYENVTLTVSNDANATDSACNLHKAFILGWPVLSTERELAIA